jgi:hypothetical protein
MNDFYDKNYKTQMKEIKETHIHAERNNLSCSLIKVINIDFFFGDTKN